MKIKLITNFLFVACFLLIYSCEETEVNSALIDTDVYLYLPLKIGNKWIYKFDNSSEHAIIKREIKNQLTHEDGATIHGYSEEVVVANPNPNEPIVGYYSHKENAIYYYSGPKDTMFPGTSILTVKLPLIKSPVMNEVSWIVKNDTFKINCPLSISFQGVTYNNTILVVRRNNNVLDSMWFSKGIGLVKEKLKTNWSTVHWELESYVLN